MIRSSNKILGTMNKEMIPKVLRIDALSTEIGSRNEQSSRGCMNEMRDGPWWLRWVTFLVLLWFSSAMSARSFLFQAKEDRFVLISGYHWVPLRCPKESHFSTKLSRAGWRDPLGRPLLMLYIFSWGPEGECIS